MKKYIALVLTIAFSTSIALAADVDLSAYPAAVQKTIKQWKGQGDVRKVKTRDMDGETVYEVEYKERGADKKILVAQDGSIVRDEQGPRGKGKGKAKGLSKQRGNRPGTRDAGNDNDVAPAASQPATAPAQPAPAPSAPVTAAPAQPAPPANQPAATTTQAQKSSKPAPISREARADFNRRYDRINQLDSNRAAALAGISAIEKETGIPQATLRKQRDSYDTGMAGLLVANEIAKSSGRPMSEIVNQRKSGRTWEAIATAHQYDATQLIPKLERVQSAMETAAKQKR